MIFEIGNILSAEAWSVDDKSQISIVKVLFRNTQNCLSDTLIN